MGVPKRKECEFYKEGEALSKSSRSSMRGVTSLRIACYCTHKEAFGDGYPSIESNELKTSPKWCPLRISK